MRHTQSGRGFSLAPSEGERAGVRIPRKDPRIGLLNLVGTRSTASLTSWGYGEVVERVPTIPKRRFLGRGGLSFVSFVGFC